MFFSYFFYKIHIDAFFFKTIAVANGFTFFVNIKLPQVVGCTYIVRRSCIQHSVTCAFPILFTSFIFKYTQPLGSMVASCNAINRRELYRHVCECPGGWQTSQDNARHFRTSNFPDRRSCSIPSQNHGLQKGLTTSIRRHQFQISGRTTEHLFGRK